MDSHSSHGEQEKELKTLGRADNPGEIENLGLPWHQSTWLGDFLQHHGIHNEWECQKLSLGFFLKK